MSWVYLALAIALEVGGTLSLRASVASRKRRWAALMVVAYIVAFVALAAALAHGMAIGVAYGVWSAVGIVLTALLGRALFGEPFTRKMAIGIGLIVVGVLLVELGSHAA
ncbi:MAG: multidrug efflux SMR transporter [Thermomicrobiales bacterium]|nr:multidrug efflux SMR transporter [Thermomicrobiales bacterium]